MDPLSFAVCMAPKLRFPESSLKMDKIQEETSRYKKKHNELTTKER
jgi:hypothetical protein